MTRYTNPLFKPEAKLGNFIPQLTQYRPVFPNESYSWRKYLEYISKQLLHWLYGKNVGNEAHSYHGGQNMKE